MDDPALSRRIDFHSRDFIGRGGFEEDLFGPRATLGAPRYRGIRVYK